MGDYNGGKKKLDDIDHEFVWAESKVSLLFFLSYKLTDTLITRIIKCKIQRKYEVLCATYMISDTVEHCKKNRPSPDCKLKLR